MINRIEENLMNSYDRTGKLIDRSSKAIFLLWIVSIVGSITIVALLFFAGVKVVKYVNDECNGSISYCLGKTTKSMQKNFENGRKE